MFGRKKKFAKEYYSELNDIYDFTMSFFKTRNEFNILLKNNNSLEYEILAILFFHSIQSIQKIISNDELASKLIDTVRNCYYYDLKNKINCSFDERQSACNNLNKRYNEYADFMKEKEPVLAITKRFIKNSFSVTEVNDLSLTVLTSFILMKAVALIENTTLNLKEKYFMET